MSAIKGFSSRLSVAEEVDEMAGFSVLFLDAVQNNKVHQGKRNGGGCELTSQVRPGYSIRTDSAPYEIALRLDSLMDGFRAVGSQKPDAETVQKIRLVVDNLDAAHEFLKKGDNPHLTEVVSEALPTLRGHAQYLARQLH